MFWRKKETVSKARFDAAMEELAFIQGAHKLATDTLIRQRDEWKFRAEKAEAKIALMQRGLKQNRKAS